MSKRLSEMFLFDCIAAIAKIEDTKQQFPSALELLHNYHCWDSIIREFEIIGEAVNTLIKNNLISNENRAAVDFRNLLIHHYFGIDPEEVWNIIEDDLPNLKVSITASINTLPTSLKQRILDSELKANAYIPCVVSALKAL